MSLVGVLRANTDAAVEIAAIHLNFWALSTPLTLKGIKELVQRRSSRKAFVDIGIRFRVTDGTLGALSLLVPPSLLVEGKHADLAGLVLDEKINDLIFGVVAKTSGNTVTYALNGTDVTDTVIATSRVSAGSDGIISVVLTTSIIGSEDSPMYYARVRFECRENSTLLFQKGWGYAKQGFVFRCLMNDIRATAEIRQNSELSSKLLPIGSGYLFLIAPSEYIPVLASPSLHYSRLLEAGVWKDYLRGCGAIRNSHTYTIHQWRRTETISVKAPFRAYMHLHREFGLGVRLTYVFGILTVPAISLVYGALRYFGLWPDKWPLF